MSIKRSHQRNKNYEQQEQKRNIKSFSEDV